VKEKDLVNEGQRLRDALKCELLMVTLGGNGAVYISEQESVVQAPFRRAVIADTVGAGDAFSAVAIKSLLRNSPLASSLREAVDFAAEICQITGAVPQGESLYQEHEKRWKNP
jgi:fructokinase